MTTDHTIIEDDVIEIEDANGIRRSFRGVEIGSSRHDVEFYATNDGRVIAVDRRNNIHITAGEMAVAKLVSDLVLDSEDEVAGAIIDFFDLDIVVPL